MLPRSDRHSPADPLVRARAVLRETRRHLELMLSSGGAGVGGGESPAARRGLLLLVAELRRAAETDQWEEEAAIADELQRLVESPSRIVGLARKLRTGFAGLEQRLWNRLTAVRPALLSEGEWDRRVA